MINAFKTLKDATVEVSYTNKYDKKCKSLLSIQDLISIAETYNLQHVGIYKDLKECDTYSSECEDDNELFFTKEFIDECKNLGKKDWIIEDGNYPYCPFEIVKNKTRRQIEIHAIGILIEAGFQDDFDVSYKIKRK